MAEINELFEQAASLCDDFAQEITEAVESVNEVKANAEKVGRKAAEGAASLKKTIDAIEALMASAEQEIEQARQRADTGLEELIDKATATGGEIKSLVAAVTRGTTELESKKAELLGSVQKQREVAAQDLEGRHQDLEQLSKTAQETYQQAETALADFRQRAVQAQRDLDAKMAEWQKAVDDLATGAGRSADVWVSHLDALLKSAVGTTIKQGNEAVVKHNASMTALKNAYITTAPEEMDKSLEALVEQLHGVVDAIDACKAKLPPKAAEIATRVGTLVNLIEQADAAMNDADRL